MGNQKNWDVFVSHASEDKDAIARPLADRLIKLGLQVWYDEAELKIGDSLSRSIDYGLTQSTYGIVILSRSFFAKDWTEYELRGLTAKSMGKSRTILPVWHEITREDALRFSPPLADILSGATHDGIDKLALKLLSVIRPDLHSAVNRKISAYNAHKSASIVELPLRDIDIGPIRHARLSKELENRVRLIRNVLLEVQQMTLIEWMDGFQRDLRPTDEIRVWEWIAAKYAMAKETHNLSKIDKDAVFTGLLIASLGSYNAADKQFSKLSSISKSEFYDTIFNEGDVYSSHYESLKPEGYATFLRSLDAENFEKDPATIDLDYIKYLSH